MNSTQLIRRVEQTRNDLDAAQDAAHRERGLAVVEGRDPDPAVIEAPAAIEDRLLGLEVRLEQAPYEEHARELAKRRAAVEDADARLSDLEAQTPTVESEYEAAHAAARAAEEAYSESLFLDDRNAREADLVEARGRAARARAARRDHLDRLNRAKTTADLASERLAELQAAGPVAAK